MNDWKSRALELRSQGYSASQIARSLLSSYPEIFKNVNHKNLYDRVRRYLQKEEVSLESDSNEENTYISSTYSSDGTLESDRLIAICEEEVLTPELLLTLHGLNEKDWKVINYTNNYWHAQEKGGKRMLLYQSKLRVKPYSQDELSPYWLKEWFANFEPKPVELSPRVVESSKNDDILIIPIVDLHYNLLTTQFIEGSDYNVEIATKRLEYVIEDVLGRVKDRKFSKIIFPIGNDLFNANGIKGTTFKGTQQYNNIPIREAYTRLFETMINIISTLHKIAPVEVLYIPSNHDKEITFYFLHSLYVQFKSVEDISIDYSPTYIKKMRHGDTLMIFTHDLKVNRAGDIAVHEAGNLLGGVKYIEVFLSHLHHEEVCNSRNITIRRLPTISEDSSWSIENGFGSNKVSQSFIINEVDNITDILYTRVKE